MAFAGHQNPIAFPSLSYCPLDGQCPVSGRLVGCAYAAALAVQFAVIHICRGNHAAALSLGLTISGAAALACPPPSNWLSRPAETDNKDRAYVPARSVFIVTIICVAILALVYGLYDGVISNLHAQQKLSVWDYPRLFSIAGVLAAAWIADIKKEAICLPRFFAF